jgi:hypothetical protein
MLLSTTAMASGRIQVDIHGRAASVLSSPGTAEFGPGKNLQTSAAAQRRAGACFV